MSDCLTPDSILAATRPIAELTNAAEAALRDACAYGLIPGIHRSGDVKLVSWHSCKTGGMRLYWTSCAEGIQRRGQLTIPLDVFCLPPKERILRMSFSRPERTPRHRCDELHQAA